MGGTVTIIVPIVPQTHAYGYLSLCAPAQAPYETCGPGHQEPHLSWTRHPLAREALHTALDLARGTTRVLY